MAKFGTRANYYETPYSVLNIVFNLSINKKGAKFQISVRMSKILIVSRFMIENWFYSRSSRLGSAEHNFSRLGRSLDFMVDNFKALQRKMKYIRENYENYF